MKNNEFIIKTLINWGKHILINIVAELNKLKEYEPEKVLIKNNNNKSFSKDNNHNLKENINNLINPFPKYTSGSDPDLYINIFKFLKNGLINNKRCWPEYIDKINDKLIKNNKKIEFYKKIGPIGNGYGKTKLKNSIGISKFEVLDGQLYNNRIVNDPF